VSRRIIGGKIAVGNDIRSTVSGFLRMRRRSALPQTETRGLRHRSICTEYYLLSSPKTFHLDSNKTHLRHGFSHCQTLLLPNLGELIGLEEEEGRLGLFDLGRHIRIAISVVGICIGVGIAVGVLLLISR
jgi:hypothetical protein